MTRAMVVLTMLVAMLPAVAQEMISSFEDPADLQRFGIPTTITAARVQEHATDGEWSLRLEIPGSQTDTWPGMMVPVDVDSTQYNVFAFDAHNPQDEDLALSWRIDLADGDAQFGNTRIEADETERVEVWVSALGPIERILLYRRMPNAGRHCEKKADEHGNTSTEKDLILTRDHVRSPGPWREPGSPSPGVLHASMSRAFMR
ncbi:MAG: hypothetical protein ACOCZ7_02250 [Armatimonadota bacterium]